MIGRILITLVACAALFPAAAHAQTAVENVGFIPSNIWYSKEPFFAGDAIRIYTVIYNSGVQDIAGTIVFRDNGASIGTSTFSIAKGRVQDLWIDWTASEGSHAISASIEGATTQLPSGEKVSVTVANATTGSREQVVEKDTDRDSVGDSGDPDIDGDGVSNSDEKKLGTNPLVAEPKTINKNTATSTIEKIVEAAKETVAPAVVGAGGKTLAAIESFRTSQVEAERERLDVAKVELERVKREEKANGDSGSSGWVARLLVIVHTVLYFLFRIQLAFYAAIVIVLYLGARALWTGFGGNRFD